MASTNESPPSSRLRRTSQALGHDVVVARQRAMSVAEEFKAFILRGNVVDLAVGVVIGAAFSGIINSLVADLITPLIAAIGGKPDFSGLYFTVHNSRFMIGNFINALISFLIMAAVVFFFVIKPINALVAMRHRETEPPPEPSTRDCPYCLNAIPNKATRCGFCTSEVEAIA